MKNLICILLCVFVGQSLASETSDINRLSIERIFQSPALQGSAPRSLKVSPDGKRVTFL
jgi:dipeptidyl-peptidase-4